MPAISVYVRVRPLLSLDQAQTEPQRIALHPKSNQVKVTLTENRQKVFQFNQIFNEHQNQNSVFLSVEMPSLLERVLDGYHSTIFAYGQTGSGKTYTIEGGETEENEGLIPRAIKQLFKMMENRNHEERDYKVFLSFMQIYNEAIFDLIDLNEGKPLKMRWNKHHQFTVENIFEGQCRTQQDALQWWKRGQKNKIMGSHKMNNNSSRSHCILTLRVQSFSIEDPSHTIESKFQIVDLAGSERQKITKSTGVIFREGIEINKSLFTLRQVIASLYEASTGNSKNGEKIVAPYRDSKLTSLLKQSIGGNSYCVMIACLNPTSNHFEESLQTLTYASMASYISNIPIRNVDPKVQENQQLREINNQLNQEIHKMSQHIEYLSKLLEQNQCLLCRQKAQIKTEDHQLHLSQENSQPSGIISFPKIDSPRQKKNQKSSFDRLNKILSSKPIKESEKKTLKTTQDIIESISMIKDLIASRLLHFKKS